MGKNSPEYSRAWYIANRERIGVMRRARYAANRDAILAQQKQWETKNREVRLEQKKVYYRTRRKQVHQTPEGRRRESARSCRWIKLNPEKAKAIRFRHKALKRNAEGSFTGAEWQELLATYDHCCLRCYKEPPEITLSGDHVIPLTKGGTNYISNIQPLCTSCNASKGTKSTDYRPKYWCRKVQN